MKAKKGLKILVIDDYEPVRWSAKALLQEDNVVLTAGCGRDGLRILELNPDLDLLITDRTMPEMLGEEVLYRAKAMRPNLKAILMTSDDPEIIKPMALAAGADYFLNKDNLGAINSVLEELFPSF